MRMDTIATSTGIDSATAASLNDTTSATTRAAVTMIMMMLSNQTTENNASATSAPYDRDADAIYYIIVVLSFYSVGIVVAMIAYHRRERQELEEERAYSDYFVFRKKSDTMKRYYQVQRTLTILGATKFNNEYTRKETPEEVIK